MLLSGGPGLPRAGPAVTALGEVQVYLDALGMRPSDERLIAVLDLPGPTTDTNERRDAGGEVVLRLAARSNGTEFVFSGERLAAVFLGTQQREAWGVHPRPDALIEGLSGTATRPEVRARFGEPVWQKDGADRFDVDGDHLQFQYADGRIQVVVAAIGERGKAERGAAPVRAPRHAD